jgi:hypothetical protein
MRVMWSIFAISFCGQITRFRRYLPFCLLSISCIAPDKLSIRLSMQRRIVDFLLAFGVYTQACVRFCVLGDLGVDQVVSLVDNVLKILGGLRTVTCSLGRSDRLDILCTTLCCPVWWASLETF